MKLLLPKGSLQNATLKWLEVAGWGIKFSSSRDYSPSIDDENLNVSVLRPQDASEFVANGEFDAAITGLDCLMEYEAKQQNDGIKNFCMPKVVCDLVYSRQSLKKAKRVLLVKKNSSIKKIKDCANKIISTEMVEYTKKFFEDKNIPVRVKFSWGADEAKLSNNFVDAAVELVETGKTLTVNGLRIVETLFESSAVLICNQDNIKNKNKKQKIIQLAIGLIGALNSVGMTGLKFNIKKNLLDGVIKIIPSINFPTVTKQFFGWRAVEVIVSKKIAREITPLLLEKGADGIVEYPVSKIFSQEDLKKIIL